MRYLILICSIVLFAAACQKQAVNSGDPANEKRYTMTGKVISVDPAKKTATIDHNEIPGYMKPMTMTCPIRADWVWEDLKPGSDIRAELVVNETADVPYWLENIGIVAVAANSAVNSMNCPGLTRRSSRVIWSRTVSCSRLIR